jgi:transposase
LYGDVWLLEQVALKTGIRQDLNAVFSGNTELVNDILTLAMYPYLTGHTYARITIWQKNHKASSSRALTPSVITRLTQAITEQHRMSLFERRAARVGKDELCAVDSTSRSAYGDSLADIRWGKNKEGLNLPQTSEVVVYSLSNHMPLYYRTFPGNMPDSRTMDAIFADLDHSGFKNLILITDRGYESLSNLEKYILRGQGMIMATKVGQGEALKAVKELGLFEDKLASMSSDPSSGIYYKQYDIEYQVKSKGAAVKKANMLRLNLYFDIHRMARERVKFDGELSEQKELLAKLIDSGNDIESIEELKSGYRYFKFDYDDKNKTLRSFCEDKKKIEKARQLLGFYAYTTHGVDFNAMKTHSSYRLRDEQEKCFQMMKDQMASDRQRNWSEGGKTGRLFILFVSLILGSHVRHVWGSTKLRELFPSALEMVDEMSTIRCIEHTNRAGMITPFVGKQVDVCEAFGFAIPEGCAPTCASRQMPKRKRGRPPKKRVEVSF